MQHFCRLSAALDRRSELQQASGISCGNHIRMGGRHVRRFPIGELIGGLRLHEIVDTRGPATDGSSPATPAIANRESTTSCDRG